MVNRLKIATIHLLNLMRAYGHRAITVNVTMEGKEVDITANSFVRRQLSTVGIVFPYEEVNKPHHLNLNKSLDKDMLSVIFHEALFELEYAYIEKNCIGDPRAKGYIKRINDWIERKQKWLECTFPAYSDDELDPFPMPLEEKPKVMDPIALEKAKVLLEKYGINKIETTDDLDRIFWELAIRRKVISKPIKTAIPTVITNDRLLKTFNHRLDLFNGYLQNKIKTPEFQETERQINDLTKSNKKLFNQVEQLQSQVKKEKNRERQEIKREENMYRKHSKKFMNQLKTRTGRFMGTYDFTNEKDITEYLSWFKVIKRPVSKKTIRQVSKFYCKEPGSDALFVRMVEEYNSQYTPGDFDDDTFDDSDIQA